MTSFRKLELLEVYIFCFLWEAASTSLYKMIQPTVPLKLKVSGFLNGFLMFFFWEINVHLFLICQLPSHIEMKINHCQDLGLSVKKGNRNFFWSLFREEINACAAVHTRYVMDACDCLWPIIFLPPMMRMSFLLVVLTRLIVREPKHWVTWSHRMGVNFSFL